MNILRFHQLKHSSISKKENFNAVVVGTVTSGGDSTENPKTLEYIIVTYFNFAYACCFCPFRFVQYESLEKGRRQFIIEQWFPQKVNLFNFYQSNFIKVNIKGKIWKGINKIILVPL